MVYALPQELRVEEHVVVVVHPATHAEAHVQDALGYVRVVVDVDDVDVVLGGRDDGGERRDEVVVERREEGGLRDVVEADGDAVVQHALRHQPHVEAARRLHLVDAV